MQQQKYNKIHLLLAVIFGATISATYILYNPYDNMQECISDQKMKIVLSNSRITNSSASDISRQYCKAKYFNIVYRYDQ